MKKKLLGILLIALGSLFAYTGFTSDIEYSELSGMVFCIVLVFLGLQKLGIIKKKMKQSKAKATVPPPAAAPAPIQQTIPRNTEGPRPHFVNFRVAGVTFNNDDGINRQNIIADIDHQRPPFQDADNLEVSILKSSHEGKLAFEVRVNDVLIGHVPAKQVGEVAAAIQHPDAKVSGFSVDGGSDGYNYGVGIAIKYTE